MILILALVSATLQPPAPRVGDLITVTFEAPVVIDASSDFEVVSQTERSVVLRTFEPQPFTLSGVVREPSRSVQFRNLQIPVQSVLTPGDDLTPAPLSPPVSHPYPPGPFVAIAIAAALAIAAWSVVFLRSRVQRDGAAVAVLDPAERYRRALLALRAEPSGRRRWAALADETRLYLAATRPQLGADLTTSELLPRLDEPEAVVVEVLRQGDLEKFSPFGASGRDFDEVVRNAIALTEQKTEQLTEPKVTLGSGEGLRP